MKSVLAVACLVLMATSSAVAIIDRPEVGRSRTFHFVYQFVVSGLSENKEKVQIWAPLPSSGPLQEIRDLQVVGPWSLTQRIDPEYHNHYFYSSHEGGSASAVTFTVSFDVKRLVADAGAGTLDVRAFRLDRFKSPDREVPLTGPIAKESEAVLANNDGPRLAPTRMLYDHIVETVRYDKTGVGWGKGDALWACDSRHGNCTDFHSLFIGLARHAKIPARFVIGFHIPEGPGKGTVASYHCWAETWEKGLGWVPIDASEAFNHPEKKEFYYGHLDADRVQFSMGRDIKLKPSPQTGPLNYFVYPHVERNGVPYTSVATKYSFN